MKCKELDGTSQKGNCKEPGGTEGVVIKKNIYKNQSKISDFIKHCWEAYIYLCYI